MTNPFVHITFVPAGVKQAVAAGTTIMAAAHEAGVLIESPCNCAGTCGKCKVKIATSDLSKVKEKRHQHLSQAERNEGFVLACLTEVYHDLTVELQQDKVEPIQIIAAGKQTMVELQPAVAKVYDASQDQTQILHQGQLLGFEDNDTTQQTYGVVVDIGTTTLVVSLVNLLTGDETGSASALNPQSIYAQDVLSRIKFASNPEGLKLLHHALVETLNQLINQVCKLARVQPEHIYEVVYSGNTCMLHLAAAIDPTSLGKFPYTPNLRGDCLFSTQQCGLEISPLGQVYFPPILSAYVGADITAGLLAGELAELAGVTLFVDIGTNGEMVLARNGQLAAASTAAGPAFEGMNISCGMRAAQGAVERFYIQTDGTIIAETIGNQPAVGLCGSGLLDVAGELVAQGLVKQNGRFITTSSVLPEVLLQRLQKQDGKPIFKVDHSVYLSQKDLRQIQLAKGAIRAGIELLLRSQDLSASDVDRVYIAGSFGFHLRTESLINIGLLPASFQNKLSFIGNTAKTGGQALLLNQNLRSKLVDLVQNMTLIELSDYQDFEQVFVKSLNF